VALASLLGAACGETTSPQVDVAAGRASCVPGTPGVETLGRALFGGGEVAPMGETSRLTTRWFEGCGGPRTVRATLTDPTGNRQPLEATSVSAPFKDLVEASFEFSPTRPGLHLLEAWLEPGAVLSTVEVIVPVDRTRAPVFEEAVPFWPERFERWVARTTAGLLISGARHSRGGQLVPTPPQFPGDPDLVVAVKNTVWTRSTEFRPSTSITIARWTDNGTTLVLDGQASVAERCHISFVDAEHLLCTGNDVRFDFHWNGRQVLPLQRPKTEPYRSVLLVGDRRFFQIREGPNGASGNVLCEEDRATNALTCREDLNILGLSPVGPLIREFTTNRLGVWGKEGRSWWYSSGGLNRAGAYDFGMVEDQAVALEAAFTNLEVPPDHRALVMTANANGLQFERYELGPPLGVRARPHQIVAILHDWVVVKRSRDNDRVFFIARR
jgi:hypothetical protein